jgi:hypothetical protein
VEATSIQTSISDNACANRASPSCSSFCTAGRSERYCRPSQRSGPTPGTAQGRVMRSASSGTAGGLLRNCPGETRNPICQTRTGRGRSRRGAGARSRAFERCPSNLRACRSGFESWFEKRFKGRENALLRRLERHRESQEYAVFLSKLG